MSTSVIGFRPPDKRWHQMKAIWESCTAAGVDVPETVERFFDYQEPSEHGVEVNLGPDVVREYTGDGEAGFEVFVEKLPPDIKVIRFYNSW